MYDINLTIVSTKISYIRMIKFRLLLSLPELPGCQRWWRMYSRWEQYSRWVAGRTIRSGPLISTRVLGWLLCWNMCMHSNCISCHQHMHQSLFTFILNTCLKLAHWDDVDHRQFWLQKNKWLRTLVCFSFGLVIASYNAFQVIL